MATEAQIQELRDAVNRDKIALESFVIRIKDALTVSCQIPITIPDKSIIHIIREAKKWFYKHYKYSVEPAFLYIDNKAFYTDDFKNTRALTLPDAVYSVYNLYKIGPIYDVMSWHMKYTNTYVSYMNRNTTEDLMAYIIGESYNSFRRQMLRNESMRFNFNYLTHKFIIMGSIPTNAVVLEVDKTIDDEALFEDEMFFSYVLAQVRIDLANILGTFNYNLPGGIQINFDQIQTMGQDKLDKIIEDIKSEEGLTWFFTS